MLHGVPHATHSHGTNQVVPSCVFSSRSTWHCCLRGLRFIGICRVSRRIISFRYIGIMHCIFTIFAVCEFFLYYFGECLVFHSTKSGIRNGHHGGFAVCFHRSFPSIDGLIDLIPISLTILVCPVQSNAQLFVCGISTTFESHLIKHPFRDTGFLLACSCDLLLCLLFLLFYILFLLALGRAFNYFRTNIHSQLSEETASAPCGSSVDKPRTDVSCHFFKKRRVVLFFSFLVDMVLQ